MTNFALLDDKDLLELVLMRNDLAWKEFLRRFQGIAFKCITKIAAKFNLSLDDIHEIFGDFCVKILRDDMQRLRAYDVKKGTKLGSWLGLLATNATYDFLRYDQRHNRCTTYLDPPYLTPSALDIMLDRERHNILTPLRARLTYRDQQFFDLCFRAELDTQEIANTMGISVQTVHKKKHRIQATLMEESTCSDLI